MASIRIAEIVTEQASNTAFLATRYLGELYCDELLATLNSQDDRVATNISLADVVAIDVSFADAVFGKLASLQAHKQAQFSPIIITDANETCVMNIEAALKTRLERENVDQRQLRNCVLPMLTSQHNMVLLGKFEQHVQESFSLLQRNDVLTARDIVDKLNLSLNAASTRLKALYDLRLATRVEQRDEQGKQYIYHKLA